MHRLQLVRQDNSRSNGVPHVRQPVVQERHRRQPGGPPSGCAHKHCVALQRCSAPHRPSVGRAPSTGVRLGSRKPGFGVCTIGRAPAGQLSRRRLATQSRYGVAAHISSLWCAGSDIAGRLRRSCSGAATGFHCPRERGARRCVRSSICPLIDFDNADPPPPPSLPCSCLPRCRSPTLTLTLLYPLQRASDIICNAVGAGSQRVTPQQRRRRSPRLAQSADLTCAPFPNCSSCLSKRCLHHLAAAPALFQRHGAAGTGAQTLQLPLLHEAVTAHPASNAAAILWTRFGCDRAPQ